MTRRTQKDTHDHVAELVERCFGATGGELTVGGVSTGEIAATYGTPAFVYCRDALDRTWLSLRDAVPSEFDIYYSIKANPNQTILQYFLDKGCGLEIASAGELHQALVAGCRPERVIFAGPGKTDDELSFAVAKQIGAIHVESAAEAVRLSAIAERSNQTVSVALRVNPAAAAQGGAMRMGGQAAPFGIDEECLADAVDAVSDLPGLDLRGVHLYTGTQILDGEVLIAQYHKTIEIAEQVARRIHKPLETIDFGGGLGIPYFCHEQQLDLAALRDELGQFVAGVKRRPLLAEARLMLEPGRFLVGEAGIYVARVIEVKRSRGKTFVITDGGMHHHLAASGNLGQTIKRNYPVALVNKLNLPVGRAVDIVGPLCTPLDVLARSAELPVAEPGDLVGIFQSGAYARSASPLGFLSHPSPPEIWVEDGQHRVIRVRGEREDYLVGQVFNPSEHI